MSNAIATMTPVQALAKTIRNPQFQQNVREALPPGVSLDRFTRTTLTAIQQNPDLVQADRQSLFTGITRAAQDGLLPDGREGALVIFNRKAGNGWSKHVQWMPMVAGIIKRLAQSGISIDAQVVYENDEFSQTLGDDAAIHHKAPPLGKPRGEPLGAYAIARTRDGLVFREVMDVDQIEQVRSASRAKDSGPWAQWWTEMARKTVIRRLSKRLPITDPSVTDAIQRDDELYDFDATEPEAQDQPKPSGPRRPQVFDHVAPEDTAEPEPAEAVTSEDGPPPGHHAADPDF